MIFKKFMYSYGMQIKNLCDYKLVRATKQSEMMQQVLQRESHEAVWTIYLEGKVNIYLIYYVFK